MDSLRKAEKLYLNGDVAGTITLLRSHLESTPNDIETWHRLSLLEEQAGNDRHAGIAHGKCLSLAPNLAIAYIYAGFWLSNKGRTPEAAAAYSIAFDMQPERFLQSEHTQSSHETWRRIDHGRALLYDFLQSHHRQVSSKSMTASNGEWVRLSSLRPDRRLQGGPPNSDFSPELFRLNGVRKQPYYDPEEFSWKDELLSSSDSIREELKNVQSSNLLTELSRPYLAQNSISSGPLKSLAGSNSWSAIDLYRDGIPCEKAISLFDLTNNSIKKMPTYGLTETPFEAFFSQLKPNQHIAPHFGQSNHSLTVHLTVDAPSDAYLEVSGEKRYWQDDKLLIFDDSFLHSAHNPSMSDRTILLFSVWHPDLNAQDKEAIQASFIERGKWLDKRQEVIFDALPTP